MRLTEFASAEDTLALWKMISDNTWAAIAQQVEAEAKREDERAAARKSASKRGAGKRATKPMPPKRLPPPLQHVSAPVAKDAMPSASAETKPSNTQQQQPVQTTAALPSANAVQPIQPAPPVNAMSVDLPVNTALKKSVHQPPFKRNLSNAAGQKT
jgi:hypothetical protein